MTPEAELIESANALAQLIEGAAANPTQKKRDKDLRRPARRIEKLARSRFRAQLKAVLQSHMLHGVPMKESADDKEKVRSDSSLALGAIIYHQPVTAAEVAIYDGAITAAVNAGAVNAAQSMNLTGGSTESFISEYLKANGFTKLTGEIDKTSVDRLARAIADAFEKGADYDGVVKAVKAEFADFTTTRVKMIAATELNDAFNSSILKFGQEAGGTMKYWDTDLAPCLLCLENEIASPIPIDDLFPSGDDAPTLHPNCACSLRIGVEL